MRLIKKTFVSRINVCNVQLIEFSAWLNLALHTDISDHGYILKRVGNRSNKGV